MTDSSAQIAILNTLIATTIDSIDGYEESATNIEGERFRELFRERARERQQVVESLREEVRRIGGNPEDDGSFLGAAHRRFEDLKAAITGKDDKAIINEVERGEDYLKTKFEAALKNVDLAPEARAAVDQAWTSVKAGHDEMSGLKHRRERVESYAEGREDATIRQQEYASESDRRRQDDPLI